MNARHIHQLVLNRRDTSWGPGRWAANGALAEAVDDVADVLLPAADYGLRRKERQREYARRHEAKRRESRKLAKARDAVLEALTESTLAGRSLDDGAMVALWFDSEDDAKAFHVAVSAHSAAVRAAALSDLARAEPVLDAAE